MSVLSALNGASSVISGKLFNTLPVPTATPELPSQTFIVTGANTGLGFEACLHLSRLGLGKLIMAVRTPSKGTEARAKVLAATSRPESSIEVWPLDMASHASIKTFAERAAHLPRLDGVLANAGIMTTTFVPSAGTEETLNINVIGPFLLFLLLLPKLREAGRAARYVIPNSALHHMAPLAELDGEGIFARLGDPAKADMEGRYPLSKLLVLFAVRELAVRMGASEKGTCVVNTPNPSLCKSNLTHEQHGSRGFKAMEGLLARTAEEGSRTLVHGLLAGEETNGQYLSNCRVETPACHVTNDWGKRFQKRFFDELLAELEEIEPGVSLNT